MRKLLSLFFIAIALLCASAETKAQEDGREWRETIRENLYEKYQKELQQYGEDPMLLLGLNNRLLAELSTLPKTKDEGVRVGSVTMEQAREIYNLTKNHPVVGLQAMDKYDPERVAGFCFGRAAFVHLELLRRGVKKEAIQKLFVIGEMKTQQITWQFHVTTIVRNEAGAWIAIDPFFSEIRTSEYWYDGMTKFAKNDKLRLYITHPSKIGPSGWEYNVLPGGLKDPVYNRYFEDLFKSFKQPVQGSYKRARCAKVFNKPVPQSALDQFLEKILKSLAAFKPGRN